MLNMKQDSVGFAGAFQTAPNHILKWALRLVCMSSWFKSNATSLWCLRSWVKFEPTLATILSLPCSYMTVSIQKLGTLLFLCGNLAEQSVSSGQHTAGTQPPVVQKKSVKLKILWFLATFMVAKKVILLY